MPLAIRAELRITNERYRYSRFTSGLRGDLHAGPWGRCFASLVTAEKGEPLPFGEKATVRLDFISDIPAEYLAIGLDIPFGPPHDFAGQITVLEHLSP